MTTHVEGINVHTTGLILIIVGGLGLILGLFLLLRDDRSTGTPPPPLPVA